MSINVSTLVKYLKTKLDTDLKLQNVKVQGEISNFHRHSSGHLYFSLKDEKSQISCVMFSSRAVTLKFVPKNGDQVEVSANTSIFETSGQLQLYVNTMKQQGIGDLYQQYELLKEKLSNEGYFDDEHKKQLPTHYPQNIAVVVGENSAAMSDIKTCFLRRWPLCNVDYYPSLVQGKDAPKDLIFNLKKIDKLNYDIIILARGGGSFEDLFCFNDEELVKTIFSLKTYIVSGIGHEQDFTLADFVSDLRAPTPTACVELVTPNIVDVYSELEEYNNTINSLILNKIESLSLKLDYEQSKINLFTSKLELILNNINTIKVNLTNSIINRINKYNLLIDSNVDLLKAYSIDQTLKRGFSLVYKDSKLLKDKTKLKKDDQINVKLYKGQFKAKVEEL